MPNPRVTRPHFPEGYVDNPTKHMAWDEVERKLREAIHYWLCSVRPNHHPHAIPKWAVWVDDHIYFDGSPQTRHARNIAHNKFVTVHLESGEQPVIVQGTATEMTPSPELAVKVAQAYTAKYAARGYSPEPHSWDNGGLFEIEPHTVIAWSNFAEDPTKFLFTSGPD